jgi:hypothetical protein
MRNVPEFYIFEVISIALFVLQMDFIELKSIMIFIKNYTMFNIFLFMLKKTIHNAINMLH